MQPFAFPVFHRRFPSFCSTKNASVIYILYTGANHSRAECPTHCASTYSRFRNIFTAVKATEKRVKLLRVLSGFLLFQGVDNVSIT